MENIDELIQPQPHIQGWRNIRLLWPRSQQLIAQIRPEYSLFPPNAEINFIAAAQFRGNYPF